MEVRLIPIRPLDYRKPNLILAHGFMGDHRDWNFLEDKWPDWNLLSFDLPGHGSHVIGENFEKVDFFLAFQKALEILSRQSNRPYALLGYSMGGRVLMEFLSWALPCAQKIVPANFNMPIKLIIISSQISLSEEQREARRQSDFEIFSPVLAGQQKSEDFLRQWYANPIFQAMPESLKGQMIQKRLSNFNPKQLQLALRNFSPALQKIDLAFLDDTQAHYGYGTLDQKYADLAKTLPGGWSSIFAFEGCSHAPHVEMPEAFAEVLRSFL